VESRSGSFIAVRSPVAQPAPLLAALVRDLRAGRLGPDLWPVNASRVS